MSGAGSIKVDVINNNNNNNNDNNNNNSLHVFSFDETNKKFPALFKKEDHAVYVVTLCQYFNPCYYLELQNTELVHL